MKYLLVFMVLLAGCSITGNVVFSTEVLSDVEVTENAATVHWTTNQPRSAMFVIDEDVRVFDTGRDFETKLTGLSKGTKYEYVIVVCDEEDKCQNHQGSFTTAGEKEAAPFLGTLGAAIQIPDVSLPEVPLGLIAVVVLGVAVAGLVVQRGQVMTRAPAIEHSIRLAKEEMSKGNYPEAVKHYHKSREQYTTMKSEKRGAYHSQLVTIYNGLQQQKMSGKANRLVEKYADGSISPEELNELTELLTK